MGNPGPTGWEVARAPPVSTRGVDCGNFLATSSGIITLRSPGSGFVYPVEAYQVSRLNGVKAISPSEVKFCFCYHCSHCFCMTDFACAGDGFNVSSGIGLGLAR